MSGAAQKALRAFTTNLNDQVKKGKVDPIIGMDLKYENKPRRRTKNNE